MFKNRTVVRMSICLQLADGGGECQLEQVFDEQMFGLVEIAAPGKSSGGADTGKEEPAIGGPVGDRGGECLACHRQQQEKEPPPFPD